MKFLVFLEHHEGKLQKDALGEPPARGDTVKIEDDGSAAEKIVQFLQEKKAL